MLAGSQLYRPLLYCMLQQQLCHTTVRQLADRVVGESGGNGNILSRHGDAVPNRLKESFRVPRLFLHLRRASSQ